ncbi:response regulator transcription factor [Paeniroseomonas aquatica]|uniref:Response regulator transcription factor n=1 Tax=Paeniroseomonas aquatica TaxID=373043 RepID=A0ABT8A5S8_9PROT|nr:response regulator transcription factor [Paeniroseomonas aquatica]MDN3565147.1 response regulator transcription factor [Paeniroseomonas aquatica]
MSPPARESEVTDESCHAVLIDSQRLFREALHRILQVPPLTVVGQGRSLDEAVAELPPGLRLHLAIYNFGSDAEAERELPNVQALRARHPGIKSVVLTDCRQPEVLLKAVGLGVEAFLSRDISVEVLQRALELVLLGQYLLPTSLAQLLLHPARPAAPGGGRAAGLAEGGIQLPPGAAPLPDQRRTTALTPRECEILQCLTDGRSNKEIARDLDLTEATVKAHVKALLRKTQMTNRTQAAIWAMTQNLGAADRPAPAAPPPARPVPRPGDDQPARPAGLPWSKRCDLA